MKTYAEIIDETLAAGYTLTNRGVENDHCFYIAPESGVMCAVGRCCIAPQADWVGPFTRLARTQRDSAMSPDEREAELKPEYRGHSAFFWMELQWLHDDEMNWTDSGLSIYGERCVNELRAKWCHLDSTN